MSNFDNPNFQHEQPVIESEELSASDYIRLLTETYNEGLAIGMARPDAIRAATDFVNEILDEVQNEKGIDI